MNKLKEIEQQLIEMINVPGEYHDYKANAYKELEKAEKAGLFCPHIAFIVQQYPGFNSIMIRVEQPPERWVMQMYVNVDTLKGKDKRTKKAIHKLAKMIYGWQKEGAEQK